MTAYKSARVEWSWYCSLLSCSWMGASRTPAAPPAAPTAVAVDGRRYAPLSDAAVEAVLVWRPEVTDTGGGGSHPVEVGGDGRTAVRVVGRACSIVAGKGPQNHVQRSRN